MNRSDYKKLTRMRMSDAKRLLKSRRNDAGAYYMAGYAVECALKACIAKNMGLYPFPPEINDKKFRERYFTHNLANLLVTADLDKDLDTSVKTNPILDAHWTTLIRWDEKKRYETKILRREAEGLINAIEDPVNGVLAWLKKYW